MQGVAGLYYLDATAAGAFDTPSAPSRSPLRPRARSKTESYAAFADVSFDLTDALSASLGARWTHDERQGTVYRQNFTGLGSPLFGVTTGGAGPGALRLHEREDLRGVHAARQPELRVQRRPHRLRRVLGGLQVRRLRHARRRRADAGHGQRLRPGVRRLLRAGAQGQCLRRPAELQRRGLLRRLHRPADHPPGADGHRRGRELRRQRRQLDDPGRGARGRDRLHRAADCDLWHRLRRRRVRRVPLGHGRVRRPGADRPVGHRRVPEHARVERQPDAVVPARARERQRLSPAP